MKLSIITPSYNQGEFLERTIKSVVTQKGIDKEYELEYIIMDGGSTDNSVNIIKNYAKKYKFIQWISKKDKGQSDAIERGFKKATGDILAWINSDDEYTECVFSEIVKIFEDTKVPWVTGYAKIINEDHKEILPTVTAYKNFLSFFPKSVLYTENFISQPSTFFRKDAYESIGKITNKLFYCMDYDLWLRLLKLSKPYVVRRPLSLFRRYGKSKSGSGYVKQFEEQYQIAKKYTKNPFLLLLHKIQNWKTIFIYKIL